MSWLPVPIHGLTSWYSSCLERKWNTCRCGRGIWTIRKKPITKNLHKHWVRTINIYIPVGIAIWPACVSSLRCCNRKPSFPYTRTTQMSSLICSAMSGLSSDCVMESLSKYLRRCHENFASVRHSRPAWRKEQLNQKAETFLSLIALNRVWKKWVNSICRLS